MGWDGREGGRAGGVDKLRSWMILRAELTGFLVIAIFNGSF